MKCSPKDLQSAPWTMEDHKKKLTSINRKSMFQDAICGFVLPCITILDACEYVIWILKFTCMYARKSRQESIYKVTCLSTQLLCLQVMRMSRSHPWWTQIHDSPPKSVYEFIALLYLFSDLSKNTAKLATKPFQTFIKIARHLIHSQYSQNFLKHDTLGTTKKKF